MKKIFFFLFISFLSLQSNAQNDSIGIDTVQYKLDQKGSLMSASYKNKNLTFVNMRLLLAKDYQAANYANKAHISGWVYYGFCTSAVISSIALGGSLFDTQINKTALGISAVSWTGLIITKRITIGNLKKSVTTFNKNANK